MKKTIFIIVMAIVGAILNGTAQSGALVYKIQVLSSDKKIPLNSDKLKNIKNPGMYIDKDIYIYTAGEFTNQQDAKQFQSQLRENGFKDAFVIAMQDGKRITINSQNAPSADERYKMAAATDSIFNAAKAAASFDYNKEGSVIQNQGTNTNSSDAAITLLKEEMKRDSLYLHTIKKLQEDINTQNQKISGDVSRLLEKLLEQDTEYQNNFKKQGSETQKQQEQLQQQVDKIAGNVSAINSTLANSFSKKEEETWKPQPLSFGINVNGLLTSSGIAKRDGIFYLALTPGPHFRIEAEFSGIADTTKSDYYFAGGMLGMWQLGKTNGYAGLKLMRISAADSINIFVPTIGAEYAFASHFTIGSEIGFPMITDVKNHIYRIEFALTRIILRFYIGKL